MKGSTLTLAFRQPRTLSSPLEQVVKSRCPYNSCFVPRPSLWPLLLLFVAALASPAYAATGDMDPGFNPAVNGIVYSTAMQPDGKIIIGGEFTTVGGLTRNRVARLNEDGSLDTGFNPDVGGTNGASVHSTTVQADGKIIIAGYFAAVGGTARTNLARLNADGTLDRTFTANANWFVFSTAVQTDGKILIAGQFTTLAGAARANLARLNADGSLDFGFTPNVGFQVYSVAVQPDGKIVIGGTFFFIGGTPRNRIARLNTDGSLDPGFNPDADGWISGIAMQADGKIIIGGFFRAVGGLAHTNIARLNVDGTVDSRFNPHANDAVLSIALQTDGEIIIGGTFTSLGGTPRSRLARLNADGTTDTAFDLGIDSVVYSTALQANGKVVIGGKLVTVDDPDDPTPPRFIARLENDAATQNLIVTNASEVEWLRGGASPEAQDVSFELSTDAGKTWTVLGAGIRSAGGYTLTGLSLPANGQVRARARVIGGYYNGSAGFVELVSGFSGLDTVPHVGTPIANVAVNEDAANTVIDLHPVFQDAETAEADLVYSIQTNSNPTLVSATIDNTTDTLTLDYQANQFGTAAITVRATDTAGLYVDDTFVVTVNQVHDGDPGDLDLSFNPNVDGTVHSTALQPDGKIIIGGTFTFVGGVARNNLARLNADGSLDPGFNSKASFNVTSMAVQADGKIVIGGGFTSVDGTTRNRVARLNPDGSLDTGFNPDANDFVYNTVVQVDGKIVIGGAFTTIGGVTRNRLARLNADGSLDTGFNPDVEGTNFPVVYSTTVQVDGKMIIGGYFTNVNGSTRANLARLNADGMLDLGFDPEVNNSVLSTTVQADGKIVIGGWFTAADGVARNHLARLNPDGSLDPGFDPNVNDTVWSAVMQADEKIVVGGWFTAVDGVARNRLARLNPDGSLDTGFNLNVDNPVYAITLQADGKIVIGGIFTGVGRMGRNHIARLANDAAPQSFNVSSATHVEWQRGGALPEAQSVAFDLSTDRGTTWVPLGIATRITGGWELTGLSLSTNSLVRARARVTGGQFNGSSGLVEAVAAFPFSTRPTVTNPITDFAVNEDAPNTVINLSVVFNDAETPPGNLNYFVQANTNAALLTATITARTNLILAYAPNQFGSAMITVRATDTAGLYVEDTFTVTVTQLQDGDPGEVDAGFNPSASGEVYSTTVQPDGKMIIAGTFTAVGGAPRNYLARLHADDALELGFYPSANSGVYCTAVQADGKIIVAGSFTNLAGAARNRIARLNADGTPDTGFNPAVNGIIECSAVQTDGKIVIGGGFSTVNGMVRNYFARLNADGTVDQGFNPNVNSEVFSAAVQADGKIVMGGFFTSVAGQAAPISRG